MTWVHGAWWSLVGGFHLGLFVAIAYQPVGVGLAIAVSCLAFARTLELDFKESDHE